MYNTYRTTQLTSFNKLNFVRRSLVILRGLTDKLIIRGEINIISLRIRCPLPRHPTIQISDITVVYTRIRRSIDKNMSGEFFAPATKPKIKNCRGWLGRREIGVPTTSSNLVYARSCVYCMIIILSKTSPADV